MFLFNVYHNNLRGGKQGVDALGDFWVGDEEGNPVGDGTVVAQGPFYKSPGKGRDLDIYYTLTVTFNLASRGQTRCVYWRAHLALGASGWPGSSLHAYTDVTGSQDVPINVPPIPTGSISGCKWHDLDRDGVRDADEPGLPGWTIKLHRWDPEIGGWIYLKEETTGETGSYVFTGLVGGEYRLEEVVQEGWTQTYPTTVVHEVSLSEGESAAGLDFGNFFSSLGVSVAISPRERSGLPGETLSYEVSVTNVGTLPDVYDLTVSDALNWTLNLSPQSLSLAPAETGVATLERDDPL
jgi:uncharacterized repeat protein (TIGR01451 family)